MSGGGSVWLGTLLAFFEAEIGTLPGCCDIAVTVQGDVSARDTAERVFKRHSSASVLSVNNAHSPWTSNTHGSRGCVIADYHRSRITTKTVAIATIAHIRVA